MHERHTSEIMTTEILFRQMINRCQQDYFNIDLIWHNQSFYRFLNRERLTEGLGNQSTIVNNFFKSGFSLIRYILKRGIALKRFKLVDCELAALSIMGGITNIAFDQQYCRDKQRTKAYFSMVLKALNY